MKYFIITVDTEGDNLWSYKEGQTITTNNTKYIPRFQKLCEKYGLKPVYLTNYEMINDNDWVNYSKKKLLDNKCEIGLHIHAWNTPPVVEISNNYGGNPYIIEYSDNEIEQKVKTMIDLFKDRYGFTPTTHRSGRWATSDAYFDILKKYGITVDCSMTPGLNLSIIPGASLMCGNDYSDVKNSPFVLDSGILEVPMTTAHLHMIKNYSLRGIAKSIIKGNEWWLRPVGNNKKSLIKFYKKMSSKNDCLEFMVHSSELMPGGSPYFKDEEDIEKMYEMIELLFKIAKNDGFVGITLKYFGELYEYNKDN